MHFAQILGLSVLAIGQASCAAVPGAEPINLSPVPSGELSKRETPGPVQCGPSTDRQAYTDVQVKTAYNAGKTLWKNWNTVGGYPHALGMEGTRAIWDNLPSDCENAPKRGKLVVWPILPTGNYEGGNPLADRVLMYDESGEAKKGTPIVFCGVITHRGGNGKSYEWCDDKVA